jgi:hypothetical protein
MLIFTAIAEFIFESIDDRHECAAAVLAIMNLMVSPIVVLFGVIALLADVRFPSVADIRARFALTHCGYQGTTHRNSTRRTPVARL